MLTLAAGYWAGFGLAGRLAFAGGAMVVLFAGGVVLPEGLGAAGDRARGVLEALSAGAFAVFTAVLADEGFGWEPRDIALLSSGCAAGYAGGLWLHRRSALQQVVLFASSAVAVGSATVRLERGEELVGLAVWGLAAVWLLLSWGGLLPPRRAGYLAGGAGAVFGAQAAMVAGWGYGLAVAAAVALVVAAVLTRDVALLVISAVGMFLVVPATVDHFFPDQLSVSFALLVTGMLLLAGGALVAAAVIAAGVVAGVLGVGGPWAG